MVSRVVAVSLLVVAAAWSGSFEIAGKVTEFWPENTFLVRVPEGTARLWVTIPSRTQIRMTVEHAGKKTEPVRMTENGPLELADSGDFLVTMAWDSVDCAWSCQQWAGSEVLLKRVTGYADTLFTFRFALATEQDLEVWEFTYPHEATFIVRQSWPGAKGVEEQNLDDDTRVELIGGGAFDIEVDPVEGGGEFTATLVE